MRVPSSARHPSEPYTEQSIAVLYPRTTADVSRLLRDCYEKNIAVTTFGEETISDDGSTSLQGRVRMDFKYMDKVLQVHENPTSVVVQPNVELSVLNRMLESKGLFFPLDFAPGAKIGDMLAMCNSDRNVHQHGTLKDWVISLVLVLADGTVVETNRPGRYTAKYNLTNLVIGSRGTLALVTEAVLRLTTPPQNLHIGMMAFRSLQDGLAAAMKLWDSRHSLEAIKFVDAACMQAIKRSGLTNEEVKEMPTLIVKFTGPLQRVNEQIGLFTQLCYQHSAVGLEVTNDRDRIEAIWGLRKSLGNALGMLRARPTPSQIYLQSEVTVPSLHMLELAQVEETLQSFAKQRLWFCGSVIDVGIGKMQSAIVCPKGDKADAEKLLANTQKAVLQLQGTITSLHGPGARLSDGPSPEAEQKDIETFRRVKLDLDPKGILNSDTAWPSIDL